MIKVPWRLSIRRLPCGEADREGTRALAIAGGVVPEWRRTIKRSRERGCYGVGRELRPIPRGNGVVGSTYCRRVRAQTRFRG